MAYGYVDAWADLEKAPDLRNASYAAPPPGVRPLAASYAAPDVALWRACHLGEDA
jgi:hypothetical protein